MTPARMRILGALVFGLMVIQAAWCQEAITTVAAVRSLPRSLAARGLPVNIQGVVAYSANVSSGPFVVFDGQQCIYVHVYHALDARMLERTKDNLRIFKPGMLVEIKGVTGSADYAPVIYPTNLEVVGTGPLPAYPPVSMPQLLTGSLDCQPISIEGVVQSVQNYRNRDSQRLLVALKEGGHLACICAATTPAEVAPLVDSLVEIRGVAFTYFNRRGQAVGARLEFNNRKDITVLEKMPADPFVAPLVKMGDLWTFSPTPPTMHRQCCRGIVTFSEPGSFFYLQDGDQAVRVTTQQTNHLDPGDLVEVCGFVEVPQYYAEIHEAVFRKTGRAPVPAPIPIDVEKALVNAEPRVSLVNADLHGRLVQINGRIERLALQANGGTIMWVEQGGHSVTAEFGTGITPQAQARWEADSQVEVNGICTMILNASWPALNYPRPTNFSILIRSADDVRVVHPPPWWTTRRLVGALVATATVLVLTLAWVGMLQRAIARQTERLRMEIRARRDAEVEFKATARERSRLAADLHDTLEQDLTATAFQLEAARVCHATAQTTSLNHMQLAYELLDRSRDDLRRSVWALRNGVLENHTFVEAVQEFAKRTGNLYNIPCECSVPSTGMRIPEFEANHLLLFIQEALANAFKHANPHRLEIVIRNQGSQVSVTVSDDGAGFDVNNVPGPQQGHFGLLGMRERINAIGGKLDIQSTPGKGTSLTATLSLTVPAEMTSPPPAESAPS